MFQAAWLQPVLGAAAGGRGGRGDASQSGKGQTVAYFSEISIFPSLPSAHSIRQKCKPLVYFINGPSPIPIQDRVRDPEHRVLVTQ